MATGAPGTNGVWQYGEDDSEATFSALLNKAASTTDTQIGLDRARLTALEAAGRVIQVVQDTKLDTFSSTSTSYTDVTGLAVTITPSSASNKILVFCQWSSASYNQESWFKLAGGNAGNYQGDAAGSRERTASQFGAVANSARADNNSIIFLDAPATTSAITYKLQTKTLSTGTVYVGRGYTDSDSTSIGRFPASIIAMEIKG